MSGQLPHRSDSSGAARRRVSFAGKGLRGVALAMVLVAAGCQARAEKFLVGSKNFSEQILLGELVAQAIDRAGVRVERRLSLGGTLVCDRALRAGEIDLYVEYTGTALTAILKEKPASDSAAVLATVRKEYAAEGLEWLAPLGFDNTFAIVVRGDDARRLDLRTLSDAARVAPEWRAGFGYEFMERPDGFPGLATTYGLRFREPPAIMDLGLLYRALVAKEVDVVAGNSTDGLIATLDLRILEDDRRYFPPYEAVPVARREALDRHPRARAALERLGGRITADAMRRLNFDLDGRHLHVEDVAKGFLDEIGF